MHTPHTSSVNEVAPSGHTLTEMCVARPRPLQANAVDLACTVVTPLLHLEHPALRKFAKIVLRSAKDAMRDVQRAESQDAVVATSILTPRQLKLAQQYMIDNLARRLLVTEVAGACGLSASHFSRSFRCTCGVTPHCWLLQRRVKRAKDLLENSHLTIPEIALECGFAHRVPFSKAFARITGSGPSRWRREHHTCLIKARPA